MRPTNVGSALNQLRWCPTRCTDPAWTKPRGQGGRPTATHHHGYRQCTPQAAHGHCRARDGMAVHSTSLSSITTEVPARAHIARARLGLTLRRCPVVLFQYMQGGSRCPGRAVEPERARWHNPVLGRWLGLTPEQPALCLRGFPGRLRVTLSRVSDPPGLGRRQGAQRAARETIREKRYNLSEPQACTTPSANHSIKKPRRAAAGPKKPASYVHRALHGHRAGVRSTHSRSRGGAVVVLVCSFGGGTRVGWGRRAAGGAVCVCVTV